MYDSVYGRICSEWEQKACKVTYRCTFPANTTATSYLPAVSEEGILESGKPASEAEGVTFLKYENGKSVYELKSGSYEFLV